MHSEPGGEETGIEGDFMMLWKKTVGENRVDCSTVMVIDRKRCGVNQKTLFILFIISVVVTNIICTACKTMLTISKPA